MKDWPAISAAIGAATQQPFELVDHEVVGGGCINRTWRIRSRGGRQFFVKLNDARHAKMFAAEAAGLEAIAATQTIRVPQPIAHGTTDLHSFLVLEHLELHPHGDARRLGEQLAALHRFTSDRANINSRAAEKANSGHSRPGCSATPCYDRTAPCFGFAQDNFIGTTPQPNEWEDDWVAFWRERRLGFQLRLAKENGHSSLQSLGERLLDALPAFFNGYAPQPALLHGDLWSGNHAFLADGTPAVFDPAPWYGDREADLAMTELFGGFDADFHAAYRSAYPLDTGYAVRRELYNLYHILNHANLFGSGYARQAEQMMQNLLAAAGRMT